jgi:hypothetical protein
VADGGWVALGSARAFGACGHARWAAARCRCCVCRLRAGRCVSRVPRCRSPPVHNVRQMRASARRRPPGSIQGWRVSSPGPVGRKAAGSRPQWKRRHPRILEPGYSALACRSPARRSRALCATAKLPGPDPDFRRHPVCRHAAAQERGPLSSSCPSKANFLYSIGRGERVGASDTETGLKALGLQPMAGVTFRYLSSRCALSMLATLFIATRVFMRDPTFHPIPMRRRQAASPLLVPMRVRLHRREACRSSPRPHRRRGPDGEAATSRR